MKKKFSSWGNVAHIHSEYLILKNQDPKKIFQENPSQCNLAVGNRRSYGDVCLNSQGLMIETKWLNQIINFDEKNKTITCEAGCTFEQIIQFLIPKGFFLPVTPGTKFVTLGGAIANDVHGKNHHSKGTFGNYLLEFEILRSDGNKYLCSSKDNPDYFYATIGGLGLTGIILWATFEIKNIETAEMEVEKKTFNSTIEFYEMNKESNQLYEYTVSWFDCSYFLKSKGNLRGIYLRGNHGKSFRPNEKSNLNSKKNLNFKIPFLLPTIFTGPWIFHALNKGYFNLQAINLQKYPLHYENFFYPLDKILNWNRVYGRMGFYQHQSIIPFTNLEITLKEMAQVIKKFQHTSFLSVLKTFGNINSRGNLRFARPGMTICLDFKNEGKSTILMLLELNKIISQAGGALNPSKDSFMDSKLFYKLLSCDWNHFTKSIDPNFQSDLYKRIMS